MNARSVRTCKMRSFVRASGRLNHGSLDMLTTRMRAQARQPTTTKGVRIQPTNGHGLALAKKIRTVLAARAAPATQMGSEVNFFAVSPE